jgi:hypothetical protein
MKVRQVLIARAGNSTHFAITGRVELACESVESVDERTIKVRLLEAGAGLAAGAVIVAPKTEIVEEEG